MHKKQTCPHRFHGEVFAVSFSLPSGPLISGAAAAAAALAHGRSREELERMAAFFSLLGEMLDAFALDAPGEGPVIDP